MIKRRSFLILSTVILLFGSLGGARAEEFGTRDDAKAMVEKAATFLKAQGKEKALAEFSNPKGQFIDRDLYIIAYSLDGIRLSHPYNPKLVGKTVTDVTDFDGKQYGLEIIQTAKTKGTGWVDYKFTDPVTKKMADKSLYVQKVDDTILGCGIYKR
ncbi:MAG TPA: histidine kinase [Rhodospirillaceae bacterium]|nr:histidine kinase [Rhodospirillaceae bacterium]